MLLGNIIATGGLLLFLCLHNSVAAFSYQPQQRQNVHQIMQSSTRRSFLGTTATILVGANNIPANAVVMDSSLSKGGKVKNLTPEEAEERFRAGRKTVDYLLKNYDEICDGGGDNVRRYLGTVGIASGLFGISKAMKTLSERADDIVEYTELSREIEQTIEQADGSAYMAIFVTTSTSYTPPAKYFKDAKIEIERCAKSMDELAAMIGLDL